MATWIWANIGSGNGLLPKCRSHLFTISKFLWDSSEGSRSYVRYQSRKILKIALQKTHPDLPGTNALMTVNLCWLLFTASSSIIYLHSWLHVSSNIFFHIRIQTTSKAPLAVHLIYIYIDIYIYKYIYYSNWCLFGNALKLCIYASNSLTFMSIKN